MVRIKTTRELFDDIKLAIEAELGITIPLVGPVFTFAFAAVQAAKLRIFYLAISFLQKNTFVDTADSESIGGTLERWGRAKLGRSPFAAVQGQYEVEVSGDIGYTIPASTTFKSNDSALSPGKLFILDNAFTIATTPDTMTLRALEGGLESQLNVGDLLTSTSPLISATDVVEVTAETVTPVQAESLEDYRAITLESFRLEPQGGAGVDYRLWSRDAEGVANTYPYAKSGFPTEIDIYVEANLADSTDGKGTPTTAILDDVRDVIEFNPDTTLPLDERGRRPLTDNPNVIAVTPLDVEIDIAGSTFTAAQESLIETSIINYVNTIRPIVDSIPEDVDDTIRVNRIIFAIEDAVSGVSYGAVTLQVDGVPIASSYQFQQGEIPFVDASLITFTP